MPLDPRMAEATLPRLYSTPLLDTGAPADAAMIRRALYRVGLPTPFARQPIEDWIAGAPPTWDWPEFEVYRTPPNFIEPADLNEGYVFADGRELGPAFAPLYEAAGLRSPGWRYD